MISSDKFQTMKMWSLWLPALLLGISCATPPPPLETEVEISPRDTAPPVLEDVKPLDLGNAGELPLSSVKVCGQIQDESKVVAVNISRSGRILAKGKVESRGPLYVFEVEVPLIPGTNELILTAEDSHGNAVEKKIIYLNGEPPRLIVSVGKNELPLGGHTFLQILLEEKGERKPLPASEVELKSRRGYFEGAEYHAPLYAGKDKITVYYPVKDLYGETEVVIKGPEFTGSCAGSQEIFLGSRSRYSIKLQNSGQVVANQNMLIVKVPEGLQFQEANKEGSYLELVREISWKIERIGIGAEEEFNFVVTGEKIGQRKFDIALHSGREEVWRHSYSVTVLAKSK